MKTRNILTTFLAIATLAMTTIACSNDDDSAPGASGEKGVSMSFKLDAQPSLGQFADAYVMSYVNGKMTADTLSLEQAYTKQISGMTPADTLGFVVYICTKPGIADGTYSGRCAIDCEASMEKDGQRRGIRSSDATEFEATIDQRNDRAEQDTLMTYLYTVRDNQLVRVKKPAVSDNDVTDLRPDTPTEDSATPFALGHLYYGSQMSAATNEAMLGDNLAARFADRRQWTAESLSYGDLLYLTGSDVASADKARIKEAADNGTVFVVEGGKEAVETLCAATGIPCLVTPDDDDDMYIMGKGVVDDGKPKADPIFIKLSPRDEEGTSLTDYMQGVAVDMALRHVGLYLSATDATTRADRADNPSQVINQLVSAYRVSLLLPQTVRRDDYRKKDLKGLQAIQTNIYEMNYSIWNVYSIDGKENFYYVHQELNAAFSPCYFGVYNKSVAGIAKVCEWYGKNVKTRMEPYQTSGMHLETSSPASTAGSTSYTSGVSFGLSGSVGYANKGPQASVSASLSFSSSTSYSIPDIMVYNRCLSGQKFEWEYDLADVTSSFNLVYTACTNLREGAAAGRSTLVTGADYIFSFPESSGQPQMKATLEVLLRSSCSKCGITCKVRNKNVASSVVFKLPYLTAKDFEKN